MTHLRKWLILTHRYLGIPLSLLFVVWFLSGIAMIWARGMPNLAPELRLERLPVLELDRVRIPPALAAERVGSRANSNQVVLLNLLGRPAYRFSGRGTAIVFADNGEVFEGLEAGQAVSVASQFLDMPAPELRHAAILTEPDQWTIGATGELPLHKVVALDAAGSELYVSARNGEVSVLTTRRSRALAWVAAIPHWFYFESLRTDGPLWSRVVIWSALVGSAFAVLGILVGVLQISWSRSRPPVRSRSWIPYRGSMRWHHITGLVFGLFSLTWVFSGMLSMDPWGWATGGGLGTGAVRAAFSGGTVELSQFPAVDATDWNDLLGGRNIKEIGFVRIQGSAYYDVLLADAERLLVRADTLEVRLAPFTTESIVARVREAALGAPILAADLLTEYDAYYYSRGDPPPLPVLRIKFDDPDRTWFYIDPARSRLVGSLYSRERLDRWIYNGFHSLDFAFWYQNRSAWTVGVVLLCLGGLTSSLLGMWMGFKRLYRGVRRLV